MKHFNKLFGTLAVILSLYSLILGGFNLGHHDYQAAVPNLIIGVFWFFIPLILAAEKVQDARFKAEMHFMERMGEIFETLAREEEKAQAAKKAEADSVPGRSEAHDEARKRGDAARASKSMNGVEKRLTPSQQRRINTSKGYGPITDAELREQRNEKRRAARAAKKEVQTTTSTTTQPGQTKLV